MGERRSDETRAGITNTSALPPEVLMAQLLTGGGSDAIERSEAEGQKELVASALLPARMRPSRASFEALGFTFGAPAPGDPLFVQATLPPGWSKRGTDHSMWSEIVDQDGRKQAAIFYKAAFYDRDAFMRIAAD